MTGEIYPNSDRGLREMCPGVPVSILRGIQEAAFRAGRESMVLAPPAGLVALVLDWQAAMRGYSGAGDCVSILCEVQARLLKWRPST